jgi:hypothetical protein
MVPLPATLDFGLEATNSTAVEASDTVVVASGSSGAGASSSNSATDIHLKLSVCFEFLVGSKVAFCY